MSIVLVQATATTLPLRDASIHMVVTSPPYWGLRSYAGLPPLAWGGSAHCVHRWIQTTAPTGADCSLCGAWRGHLGLEPLHSCGRQAPESCARCYVCHLRQVFREVYRVLRPDGTLWLNLGDCYATSAGQGGIPGSGGQGNRWQRTTGHWPPNRLRLPGLKPKDLVGIPWRVALALQEDGWYLRSDIVWRKPNGMPSSVQDRPTTNHEYVFLLSKSPRYFYDATAIREPAVHTEQATRSARTVWDIPTHPTADGAHFAKYPPALVERCILAGTSAHGCCSMCQAPYQRLVEQSRWLDGHVQVFGAFCSPEDPYRIPPNGIGHGRYTTRYLDKGFVPSCACDTGTVLPCTVLDPFLGSGTTALVARALGRHAIGCDLSYAYLHDVARDRLSLKALSAWQSSTPQCIQEDCSGLPLFGSAL